MFKIKDGYKLELQTPETIKILCSTKKLIDKTKNGESDVTKRFSWAKVCDKNWSKKWFIRWSISCQQKYKVEPLC